MIITQRPLKIRKCGYNNKSLQGIITIDADTRNLLGNKEQILTIIILGENEDISKESLMEQIPKQMIKLNQLKEMEKQVEKMKKDLNSNGTVTNDKDDSRACSIP